MVTLFGETMVEPAIPDFVKDFGITYETSSWILSSFLISGAVMTPISGKLSDLYGKKRVLVAVTVVYCLGVLAAGFANGIGWMISARVAMGVGFSAFPVAFGIIRESLPESKLGIGQTVFGSTFSAGAVVGLVVGAGIIQTYGWHFAFFIVFPAAVLTLVLIWGLVKEPDARDSPSIPTVTAAPMPPPSNAPMDYRGILLLAVSVVTFLTGITLIQNATVDPSAGLEVAGLLAVAAVTTVLLVAAEKRSAFPLIDLKLLQDRKISLATVILMIVGVSTFMVYQTVAILVQSPQPLGFGGDKFATAGVLLPFMVVLLVGTIASGVLLNRLGNVRMTAIGCALSSAGFIAMLAYHSTELSVTLSLAVIAGGLSFAFTGGFNVVLLSSPMESTGIALGMVLLLNLISQSIGPSVAATFQQLYQGTVVGYSGVFPTSEAYYLIFLTSAVLSVASVAVAVVLTRGKEVVRDVSLSQPAA